MRKEEKNKTTKRSKDRVIFEALKLLGHDFLKREEYEVHFTIPYNEDGGEVRGVIENFTASSSADAVKYVSEKYGFPEYDTDDVNTIRFPEDEGYGIVKVRKKLNNKDFTAEEMFKSWEFIFNNYNRITELTGRGLKSEDNREEILMSLIEMFRLPRINKLTDKYRIYSHDAKREILERRKADRKAGK